MSKKLEDIFPLEMRDSAQAWKLRDRVVLKRFDNDFANPWPGKHKNITMWCVIEGGKAVGWNESPSRGWSFPVMSYKETV